MSAVTPARQPAGSQQAVVEATLVLLERMGLSPGDLVATPRNQQRVPTFAEYVPVASAAVSAGTRRAYGSYWNRIVEHWGTRRLDEPIPSDIRQLMTWVKTHVVARRNARGGRSVTGKAKPSGLSPGSIFPPRERPRRIPVPAPADQHARRLVTTAKATEGRCLIDDEEVQAQMLPPPLSGINPPDHELDLSL